MRNMHVYNSGKQVLQLGREILGKGLVAKDLENSGFRSLRSSKYPLSVRLSNRFHHWAMLCWDAYSGWQQRASNLAFDTRGVSANYLWVRVEYVYV